jgi:hypothetical protein
MLVMALILSKYILYIYTGFGYSGLISFLKKNYAKLDSNFTFSSRYTYLLFMLSIKFVLNYRTRNTLLEDTVRRDWPYEQEGSLFTFWIEKDLFLIGNVEGVFLRLASFPKLNLCKSKLFWIYSIFYWGRAWNLAW